MLQLMNPLYLLLKHPKSKIKNLKSKIWKYIIMHTTRQHLIIRKTGNLISGNF